MEGLRVFVSRDVIFHELVFPFHIITNHEEILDHFLHLVLSWNASISQQDVNQQTVSLQNASIAQPTPLENIQPTPSAYYDDIAENIINDISAPIVESHLVVEDVNESVASPLDAIIVNDNLRRSSQVSKPPSYLQNYHCGFLLDQAVSFTSKFSLQHYISYDRLSLDFRHFVLSIPSTCL